MKPIWFSLVIFALTHFLTVLFPYDSSVAQQRALQGRVILLDPNKGSLPAEDLTVILRDTRDRTTIGTDGFFRLPLRTHLTKGQKITILVDKPGWQIEHPLGGQIRIPEDLEKDVIQVQLRPIGSPQFLTPDQLKKFLDDFAQKIEKGLTPEGEPQKIDLGAEIKRWATRYGFSFEQARAEFDKWAEEIKKNKKKSKEDIHEHALAELSDENYEEAGKLFAKLGEINARRIEDLRKKREAIAKASLQEEEALAEEAAEFFFKSGNSKHKYSSYKEALHEYEKGLNYISKDNNMPLWVKIQRAKSSTYMEMGVINSGSERNKAFSSMFDTLQTVLQVVPKKIFPEDWAKAQNALGEAYSKFVWTKYYRDDPRILPYLIKGQASHRKALEIVSPSQNLETWLSAQIGLAWTLNRQALVTTNPEQRIQMLEEAIVRLKEALKFLNPDTNTPEFRRAQLSLGLVLSRLGMARAGSEGEENLVLGVEACRRYLELSLTDAQRGTAQICLGNAFSFLSSLKPSLEQEPFLEKAAKAYEQAVKTYGIQNGARWGVAQDNLGSTYWEMSRLHIGTDRQNLQIQALKAFRHALKVYALKNSPSQWSRIMLKLASILIELGETTEGPKGEEYWAQSEAAIQEMLDSGIWNQENAPAVWGWMQVQIKIAQVKRKRGIQIGGKVGEELSAQATQRYEDVFRLLTNLGIHMESSQDADSTMHKINEVFATLWTRQDLMEVPVKVQLALVMEQTIEKYRQLQQAHTNDEEIAFSLGLLGILYRELERFPKAKANLEESLTYQRTLAAEKPEEFQSKLAINLHWLGDLYYQLENYTAAETSYKEELTIYQTLAQTDSKALKGMASSLFSLAMFYAGTQEFGEGHRYSKELGKMSKLLEKKDPHNYPLSRVKALVAFVVTSEANTQNFESIAAYNDLLAALKNFRMHFSYNSRDLRYLSGEAVKVALRFKEKHRYENSINAFKASRAIHEFIGDTVPGNREALGYVNFWLGEQYQYLEQWEDAREYYQVALALFRKLYQDKSKEQYQNIAMVLLGLGTVHLALKENTEAKDALEEIRTRWCSKQLANIQIKVDCPTTYFQLARVYHQQKKWLESTKSLEKVIYLVPEWKEGYHSAIGIYHEKLFEYSKAFQLGQKLVELDKEEISYQAIFAEAHFTTGRFAEAGKRLGELLTNQNVGPEPQVVIRIIEIGALAAQGKDDAIPGKLQVLREFVDNQPQEFKLGWSFEGTKHFIGQHEALASSREFLLDLIAGFEGKDKATMLTAVESARSNFVAAMSSQ